MNNINIHPRKMFIIVITLIVAATGIAYSLLRLDLKAQVVTDDWPAFTMIYEIKGPTISANGQIAPSFNEIHRFDFESKSEWVDTVIEAPEVSTDYGMVSRHGSYQQLQEHQLTEFDAIDGSLMQTSVDEGVRYTPNSFLVPLANRSIELTTEITATRIDTDTRVCFLEECTENSGGLTYVLDDGTEWVFADDSRGFPLSVGNIFTVKELLINDERR